MISMVYNFGIPISHASHSYFSFVIEWNSIEGPTYLIFELFKINTLPFNGMFSNFTPIVGPTKIVGLTKRLSNKSSVYFM